MNFNESMQMLGNKLQVKYGHLGFKYKKSDKTLTRHSKNFTYMIAFSSFGGNTKDSISIDVCYIINTRPYDLFYVNLYIRKVMLSFRLCKEI